MRGWFPRILAVTLLLQTAVYAIRPMVSYEALSIGADNLDLGLIAAAFSSISLLVAVPIGRWVDRWGEPRFVVIGAAMITFASLWLLAIDNLFVLALSQAALGLGHILSVVGTQTLVANRGAPGKRDARFGLFTVIVSTGQLAGPALAGVIAGSAIPTAPAAGDPGTAGFGTTPVFIAAVAITLLATAGAVSLLLGKVARGTDAASASATADQADAEQGAKSPASKGGEPRLSSRQAVRRVLSIPSMPHAMVASLTVLTTIDLLAVYLPAYGQANGLSVETVGLLLGVRAAASMASRLLMLPLIRALGRRWLLVLSIVTPALSLGAFPFVDSLPVLYVLMAVAGFGLGLGQPVTLAWVADRAPSEVRGTAIGVRLTGNRLGQTVLPAVVGAVAGAAGVAAVFLSLSVLLMMSAGAVLTADFGQQETDP